MVTPEAFVREQAMPVNQKPVSELMLAETTLASYVVAKMPRI